MHAQDGVVVDRIGPQTPDGALRGHRLREWHRETRVQFAGARQPDPLLFEGRGYPRTSSVRRFVGRSHVLGLVVAGALEEPRPCDQPRTVPQRPSRRRATRRDRRRRGRGPRRLPTPPRTDDSPSRPGAPGSGPCLPRRRCPDTRPRTRRHGCARSCRRVGRQTGVRRPQPGPPRRSRVRCCPLGRAECRRPRRSAGCARSARSAMSRRSCRSARVGKVVRGSNNAW